MFCVVIAKRVILRKWKSSSPPSQKNGWIAWFLVYIYRKYHILCLAPAPSLRRSGAFSLNISGGNDQKVGIDCALSIFFSIFVFFCMWLWCIVLFLFSIYTWDFDILITAGLPWSPLAQASWSSFFSFFIFFLSVDTLGHLVKWSDMCSCTFSCLCIERVLAVSVCLFWLFVMVFAVWLSLLRS